MRGGADGMIDFHSHILPGMDDGAENVNESLKMLRMSKAQGVDGLVATPHFYPEKEKPDSFLARRKKSLTALAGAYTRDLPDLYLGAEVAYFTGIGRCETLKSLCIVGTRVILIEMPFCEWSESVIHDLYGVSEKLGLLPVVAHIERYIGFQSHDIIYRLTNHGIRIQANASYFCDRKTRRKALKMLGSGDIHIIGSDCHNLTSRHPNLGSCMEEIKTKTSEILLSSAVSLHSVLKK